MLEPGQSSVVAHRLIGAAFVERAARRRPPSGHLRDCSVSPLVDLSVVLARATAARVIPPHAPQWRPSRPVPRAGPSRARWSARSRARQGASLALGPRRRRGFDLDGTLERAGVRQLRDGPGQVPRPGMARVVSVQDTAMDDMVEPRGARDVLPIPRCRELLGDDAINLTDAEIEEMRRHAHVLAHILLEVFLQPPRSGRANRCVPPQTC